MQHLEEKSTSSRRRGRTNNELNKSFIYSKRKGKVSGWKDTEEKWRFVGSLPLIIAGIRSSQFSTWCCLRVKCCRLLLVAPWGDKSFETSNYVRLVWSNSHHRILWVYLFEVDLSGVSLWVSHEIPKWLDPLVWFWSHDMSSPIPWNLELMTLPRFNEIPRVLFWLL